MVALLKQGFMIFALLQLSRYNNVVVIRGFLKVIYKLVSYKIAKR